MSRIAFLFPGQGAQFVGMGRELAESVPAARDLFARAAEILGFDMARLCFEGPAERLDATVFSQPALFVTSLAAYESLKAADPGLVDRCEAAAGLSLGEYTALVMAGAVDFEAGLRLVRTRGEAMQWAAEAELGGMVSVLGLEQSQVADLCAEVCGEETLEIANLLCPANVVVSGGREACRRLGELALQAGAMKVVPLAVAGAFHTGMMEPAVERLRAALDATPFRKPRIPVISNVDARPHENPEEIRQLMVRQVVQPVLWEESMRYLLANGFGRFYEIGPGRVLRGLLRRIERDAACQCVAA